MVGGAIAKQHHVAGGQGASSQFRGLGDDAREILHWAKDPEQFVERGRQPLRVIDEDLPMFRIPREEHGHPAAEHGHGAEPAGEQVDGDQQRSGGERRSHG